MGLTGSFSVAAGGTPALNYQWSKDGAPISGATSGSYTTPATAFSDTGESFTVTITNSAGSVTSTPATLTVTARAPLAGDLRFQQVDAASTVNGYSFDGSAITTVLSNNGYFTFGNATGTPLFVGTNCCLWQFLPWSLPTGVTGLTAGYLRDQLDYFQDDLNGTRPADGIGNLSTPNIVITSLSLLEADDLFGLSWIQSAESSGFDMAQHTVALSDLQAAATQEGEQSRVITAVSYNGSDVVYLSYGWQGDTSSIYEARYPLLPSIR